MKKILLADLLAVACAHESCCVMKIEEFKRVLEEKQPIEVLLNNYRGQMSDVQIEFMLGIKNGEVDRSTVMASKKSLQEALTLYALFATPSALPIQNSRDVKPRARIT
ncbi:hypothetical protein FACS1894122_09520 [Alphaproteobacteria bacterium]|nr:hypothetical protein FACS1894122_09520 [Alphaproteobacteria bacterium]